MLPSMRLFLGGAPIRNWFIFGRNFAKNFKHEEQTIVATQFLTYGLIPIGEAKKKKQVLEILAAPTF